MYTVKKVGKALTVPEGEFDPAKADFQGTEDAVIGIYPWDESGYRPEAHARLGWNEEGLQVLCYAREKEIQAKETRFGGGVCVDSCLEFFFMPFPDQRKEYINCECNAAGVMHIGFGEGRNGRTVLQEPPAGLNVMHSLHKGEWWAVSYTVPIALIRSFTGCELKSGLSMKGNFYTCDESVHPHFGVWNPVKADHPDFHRPECFGDLTLE